MNLTKVAVKRCTIGTQKGIRTKQNGMFSSAIKNNNLYCPTLLRRVQITHETSTNITRYLYSSHSPDRTKDQKPWQVRILGKWKRWIINLLLDVLVCSIAVNFYSSEIHNNLYYPTLLRRVQITCEMSTNILRYLYSSHSPNRAKDKKPWQVRILGKFQV